MNQSIMMSVIKVIGGANNGSGNGGMSANSLNRSGIHTKGAASMSYR
jgi:hypothetical protein